MMWEFKNSLEIQQPAREQCTFGTTTANPWVYRGVGGPPKPCSSTIHFVVYVITIQRETLKGANNVSKLNVNYTILGR